jgi:hypothetical protein
MILDLRNDGLRMIWWRLCLPQMAQSIGLRVRVYRWLEKDGWCGLCICNPSEKEAKRIAEWMATLGRGDAVPLTPEKTLVRHPVAGAIFTDSVEFFFRREDDCRALERLLRGIPARVHEVEVGREAVPAMRAALRGLNWHIIRGPDARLLTVEDTSRITAIRTLAALSKT